MTHTAHPYGYRLGFSKDWRSNWFSLNKKGFKDNLKEDYYIRVFLEKNLSGKMVSEIKIDRDSDSTIINIKTARAGLIIGRDGNGIEELTKNLKKFLNRKKVNSSENITMRIEEIKYTETEAPLIAEQIASQLKKRMSHSRIMKQTAEKVMANRDVKGIRILMSGRLGGTDIARSESIKRGNIPLQTLKADIDFVHLPVVLPYGTIGVKVWVYRADKV